MARVNPELLAAFAEHERLIGVQRIRVGCLLVVTLLPLGALVDWMLYPDKILTFLWVRLAGAILMFLFHLPVYTEIGSRYHRLIGVVLAMFPAISMAVIIRMADGASSPYYAGLNLILLAIGLVLQWNLVQSLVAASLVVVMYVVATYPTIPNHIGIFFNNLWFVLLTGIIVVLGNHIQTRLRRNEYFSTYELDQSRRELEATNQKLRELDEIKGRFFANVSHELRTPLTLLIGPLESLQKHPAAQDSEVLDHLQTMQANGMRLLKLINDLLDLVRMDAGQMRLHWTEIKADTFLKGILNSVHHFAGERGLDVRLNVDPALKVFWADPDKFEKVLLNLLFNAIKFTAAGKRIELVAYQIEDSVFFEVVDQGVGIAPEHLPHLFSRFWQADTSARRKYQGAGLGLALVKEFAEVHGGSVEAKSTIGIGTRMIVRLPSKPPLSTTPSEAHNPSAPSNSPPSWEQVERASTWPPAQGKERSPELIASPAHPARSSSTAPGLASDLAQAIDSSPDLVPLAGTELKTESGGTYELGTPVAEEPEPWLVNLYRRAELFASLNPLRQNSHTWTPPSSTDRPRLVVADDEPDMLRFLKSQLQAHYEIVEAVDGEQALTLAKQYLPDAVVCDMMLPEKDGLQVCRELRENHSTKSLPFLMVTARADDETKLQALTAGASDFIAKPFSLAELQVRIRNLVTNHQLQKAVNRQNQQLAATVEQLKDTELQLVQSEKMASLGRMAAGILHEINNPLNFTRTGLYILANFEQNLPGEQREEFKDTIKDLNEGVSRVAQIVSDLRTFSHPQGGEVQEVAVATTLEAALRFLAAEWRDQVVILNEIPKDFEVIAERNRLLQIFVNLLQNSLDSLRSKTFTAPEQPTIRLRAWEEEGARVLAFWDNGNGISDAALNKIFDPFFTTKDVGEGTGLGLSICYRLLQDWGGQIRVDTQEGGFCEFRLEFLRQSTEDFSVEPASLSHR